MSDEKNSVEINDLPEEELQENELDKVSGGCGGMSQDPAGGTRLARTFISANPVDKLTTQTSIGIKTIS